MNPERRKGLLFLYQRAMFYSGFALSELGKPLQLRNETVQILTLLAVFGIFVDWKLIAVIYLVIFVVLIVIGKVLITVGMAKYNSTLGNVQNPELLKIMEDLSKIKAKLEIE